MKAIELQLRNYRQLEPFELENLIQLYDYWTSTNTMIRTQELDLLRVQAEACLLYKRSFALLSTQSISSNVQEVLPMLIKLNEDCNGTFVLGDGKLYGTSELGEAVMVVQLGSIEESGKGLWYYTNKGHFEEKYLLDDRANFLKFVEAMGYKTVHLSQGILN